MNMRELNDSEIDCVCGGDRLLQTMPFTGGPINHPGSGDPPPDCDDFSMNPDDFADCP